MNSFFDGIGTEMISIILGIIFGAGAGGVVGFKMGINRNILKQEQKAKNNSKQKQDGKSTIGDSEDIFSAELNNTKMVQTQKAGNEATQVQIGGVKRGRRKTGTKGRR